MIDKINGFLFDLLVIIIKGANEAIFKLFSSIRGINNNDLFALLSQECSKISARFGITYGEAPTILQVNAAYNPMACPIKTTQCYDLAPQCYDYKIFYSVNKIILSFK